MTLSESREIRIKLHKDYYTDEALRSIGDSIISNLNCDGSVYLISEPTSQVVLNLSTPEPSRVNLEAATDNALRAFIQTTPFQMIPNMYNILITHVEGDTSTVVIMF